MRTLLAAARTAARLFAVGFIAMVVCLAAAGGAGAEKKDKPPKPAWDVPSAAGLTGAEDGRVVSTGNAKGDDPKKNQNPAGNAAPGAVGSTTLVLYDTTGAYGWLGELYATAVGNLASHFGNWKAEPVAQYQAGQISQYTATVYVGSTYDEPLPTAFLDDVWNATHPVIWIYDNIWELTNRQPSFQTKYGWMWSQFDLGAISHVIYKGVTLTRDSVHNGAGIMAYSSVDPAKATILARAVHDGDGSTVPWALRSGTLTYVGENPFVYTTETDRLRVFEDLLYDALWPSAPTRHRALVRLEDINPSQDPAELKSVADYLYSQGIPYGFGVSPVYTDPNGYYTGGVPESSRLSDKGNGIAAVIKYMQSHGGTLVMHGYTHQYTNVPNPYDAVTGDDFEFYRVVENPDHTLNYVGPIPEDSLPWVAQRLAASYFEFRRAGIAPPTMFEFPHYAASALDYHVASAVFPRWERGMYYGGVLTGGTVDYAHVLGQSFPYVVRDVYGAVVLPENCGAYAPEPFFQFRPHTVTDILAAATAQSVVRDGIAAFYYHPFEGVAPLQQIINGLRAQGWTFVDPTQAAANG